MAIKIKAKTSSENENMKNKDCEVKAIAEPDSFEERKPEEDIRRSQVADRSKLEKHSNGFSLLRSISVAWSKSNERVETKAADNTPKLSNQPIIVDAFDPESQTSEPEVIDRTKQGWNSPRYSESRSIVLDPDILHANRCIAYTGESATIDSYKIIRAQILQRMKHSSGNTLMVTSVLPGEGKTTTAINLAFIMAKEFQQTVLLVDCDLQQQDIHKRLGYPSDKGLINYLLDDCPITELFTWPGIEKITLVSGGRTIRDSSELLGSPRMKALVEDMKERYPNRFVIFDMQSVYAGADTLVFAPLVDNILMVVQEGNSSAKEIKRAISHLPEEKLLGLMLNRHKASSHIAKPSNFKNSLRAA
jgi:non-specific protein-tyrosine kinase